MIRWLFRLLRLLFWGPPLRRLPPKEAHHRNLRDSLQFWTYGMVRTDLYLNRNRKGQPYFKVTFIRLVNDERGTSNSYFLDDLVDIERAIAKIRAWVHDSNLTT